MRRIVFILLIAILPLRGWVGDAMATQMAVQAAAHAAPENRIHAAEAEKTVDAGHHAAMVSMAGMAPDCMQHTSEPASDQAESGCANCAVCQACHTVALTDAGTTARLALVDGAMPTAKTAQFASAEAALGQKPPIS